MHLSVLSIGPVVPRSDFSATIHSVFPSAVNLLMADETLLTLLTKERADLPRGIRLNTPDNFSFEMPGLVQGMSVASRAGVIRLGESALVVDTRGATLWQVDLTSIAADISREESRNAWLATLDELAEHRAAGLGIAGAMLALAGRLPAGARSTLARKALTPVSTLAISARNLDTTSAQNSVSKLIGLGPGLTPSGDDFLAGFMAGLWASAGSQGERRQYTRVVGQIVEWQARRTNDISRTLLVDAAHGLASALIVGLIDAIKNGYEGDITREAARAALQVGDTSGADGVSGVLLGLAAFQPTLINHSRHKSCALIAIFSGF